MTDRVPLITIGITCFNADQTIGHAIKSALRQTWRNIEILVVDDGSADNSVKVIERHAQMDRRIRLVIHQENCGTAEARSTLARNAKGEFLAFFDDDDVSKPDRLVKQYNRIVNYERKHDTNLVLCYSDRHVIKAGAAKVDHYGYGIGREPPEPSGHAVADMLLWKSGDESDIAGRSGQMGSCNLMLRTKVFDVVGYFDSRFRRCAEWDFAVRAAFKGAHFISVPEPLHIQYKTLTSDKAGRKPLVYGLLLRRKYRAYLKQHGMYFAALCIARSKFYGAKKRFGSARLWLGLACAFAPKQILFVGIRRRIDRYRRRKHRNPEAA